MKSKKLISFLCAAAMTVSSFAGLAITASAAETVLWSDNFDAYDNVVDGYSPNLDPIGKVLADGTTTADSVYDGIAGLKLQTANRGTDTSFFAIQDGKDSGSKSLMATTASTTAARGAKIFFVDDAKANKTYKPETGKDLVLAFNVKTTDTGVNTGVNHTILLNGDETAAVDFDNTLGIAHDTWTQVKVVINETSGTKVYVGDGTDAKATLTAIKELASMTFAGTEYSTKNCTDCPKWYFDDMVIYSSDNGAASTVPGAEGGEQATPPPEVDAPYLLAAEGATEGTVQSYTFDSVASGNWSIGTTAQQKYNNKGELNDVDTSIKAVPGLSIEIGGRSDGAEASTYAAIQKYGTGKVLNLTASRFATGGRGPRVSFDNNIPATEGTYTVTSFAFKISPMTGHEEDATARLSLLEGTTQAGDDGLGEYRHVAAVFTTKKDETIYREPGNTSSDVISTYVTPNEWHYASVVAEPVKDNKAPYRVYVDYDTSTNFDPQIKSDYVYYGETAHTLAKTPMFAIETRANKVGGVDTTPANAYALIDNIVAYSATGSEPRRVVATLGEPEEPDEPTPEPVEMHTVTVESAADGKTAKVSTTETDAFNAVLIHAKYNGTTLAGVKSYPVTGVKAGGDVTVNMDAADPIANGDKLMVWDSLKGMVPYCKAVTVANSTVQEYTVTTTGITNGTVTAEPAKTTAGTKVTLTVTPNAGYKLTTDSLKVKNGTETITPTAVAGASDKYEFTMPAANVTVEAAFEAIEYTITVDNAVKDNVTTTPASKATKDTEVTVTVTAPSGKVVDKVTYKAEGAAADTEITADATGAYKFKMPAANVTVSATFKEVTKYAITTTATGATVTYKIAGADAVASAGAQAAEGQEVEVVATANQGQKITKIEWKATSAAAATDITTTAKFTMPAEAVTVTVTTEAQTAPTYTVTGTVDAGVDSVKLEKAGSSPITGTISETTATFANVEAGEYTVTATAKTGYSNPQVAYTTGSNVKVESANVTGAFTVTTTKDKTQLSADFNLTLKANDMNVAKGQETATLQVGNTLTAALEQKNTAAVPAGVTYEFYTVPASGGDGTKLTTTGSTYIIAQSDVGNTIKVVAKPADTDANYTGSVTSETVTVTAAPDPELAGTLTLKVDTVDATETAPKVFDTLTAAYAPAEGEDDVEVTYAWSVGDTAEGNFTPIAEAEGETYDIPTSQLGKFIKVTATAEGYAEEGVSVTTLAVADIPVPTLAGTEIDKNDFSTEGDTWGFVPYKSGSVANSNGELILNNKADANSTADKQTDYKVFPEVISQAKNLEMIFDFTPDIESGKNRNVYLIISDDEAGMTLTGHSILTVFAQGDTGVTVKAGATDAVKVADVGTNSTKLKIYLKYTAEPTPHVDVLVFNIAGGDPVCVAKTSGDISGATAFNRLAARYGYSAAPFRIDNVQINSTDEGLIPVTVKTPTGGKIATDAPAVAVKDNVITITPTADPGKKLDKVTVNGEEVTDNGGYKYTVTGEETEGKIEIDATFVRADVTEIKVDGPTMIKKGTTKDYKAIVKAGEYTFTDDDNVEITWSLADETQDQAATVQDGTAITGTSLTGALAAAAGETASKIRVKAEVVTDVKSPEGKTPAYATVEFVDEDVYKVTGVAEGHGKVELKADAQPVSYIKKSSELTIETTPDEGYEVESISYTMGAEGEPKNVDKSSAKIDANTLEDDTVVTVKFKATPYDITNNDSTDDENGNKIEVDKETATVEDTVKITPTLGDNYAIKSLTAKKNGTDPIALTEAADGTFSFKMVAGDVTVDAEFVKVQEVALSADKIKTSSVNFKSPETNCVVNAEFKAGQAVVSGDKLASSDMKYDECSTAALINIDASEYANKIYGMKLSLSSQTDVANKNTWFKYFGQFENYISDLTTVNGNNINTTGGKASVVIDTGKENWDYGTGKNAFAALTDLNMNAYFMKNGAQQNKGGQVTMFIGTGTGRMTTVKEVSIKLIVEDEG